jgi:hypothetical protein
VPRKSFLPVGLSSDAHRPSAGRMLSRALYDPGPYSSVAAAVVEAGACRALMVLLGATGLPRALRPPHRTHQPPRVPCMTPPAPPCLPPRSWSLGLIPLGAPTRFDAT